MPLPRFRIRTLMIAVAALAALSGATVWVIRATNERKRTQIIVAHEQMASDWRRAADRHKSEIDEYRSNERRAQELLEAGEFTPAQAEHRAAHWRELREGLEPHWRRESDQAAWYAEQARALREHSGEGIFFNLDAHRQVVVKHIQEDAAGIRQIEAKGRSSVASPAGRLLVPPDPPVPE